MSGASRTAFGGVGTAREWRPPYNAVMRSTTILGTGSHLPGKPVSSDALGRVMDTNGEWIAQRSGIVARHFAADGSGASDLALPAARAAIESAELRPEQIDYILFNTMTPDYVLPGSGALLGSKLGIPGVPALDIRQQCAAIPFSLQVADALLQVQAARHILVVGAEAHAGFMPWRDWSLLEEDEASPRKAEPRAYALATEHRGMSVLFGDGAGAFVLGPSRNEHTGLIGVQVHSDGRAHDALRIEAGGFRRRPYSSHEMLDRGEHIPHMNGRELFRRAVQELPKVVRTLLSRHQVQLDAVDWFIAHQANDRINQAVREALGVPAERIPSNIANYGNTSSATIPILLDELMRDGRVRRGQLLCFLALGAGLNWGAALMRL